MNLGFLGPNYNIKKKSLHPRSLAARRSPLKNKGWKTTNFWDGIFSSELLNFKGVDLCLCQERCWKKDSTSRMKILGTVKMGEDPGASKWLELLELPKE